LASTASISEAVAASERPARRTLLFRVGSAVYGCDIDDIREIVPFRTATRLPGAPGYVQGLINLRGTIVTVLDLGARLATGRSPVRDGSIMLVAMPNGSRLVGVAVEEVLDVRLVGAGGEDAVARRGPADDVVRGLADIDGVTVILLDIHTLVRQVLLS
jgi:purine-binding chemotaxis protein CheW